MEADAKANATDMPLARDNPRSFIRPAEIDFAYDYDRDGRVNATDMLLACDNPTSFLNALKRITAPGNEAPIPLPKEVRAPAASMSWLSPYEQVGRDNESSDDTRHTARSVDRMFTSGSL